MSLITGTFNYVANPSVTKNTNTENVYLQCDTSLGPVIINLPAIADFQGFNNVKLFISDESGNAGTNPITINSFAGDNIDSGTSVVLNTNNASAEIQITNENGWISVESESPQAVGGTVNKVAKFGADGKTLVNSQRADDGTNVADIISGNFLKSTVGDNLENIQGNELKQIGLDENKNVIGNSTKMVGVDNSELITGNDNKSIGGGQNVLIGNSRATLVNGATGDLRQIQGGSFENSNNMNTNSGGLINGDAKDSKFYGLGSITFNSGDFAGVNGGAGHCKVMVRGISQDGTVGVGLDGEIDRVNNITNTSNNTTTDTDGGATFVGTASITVGTSGIVVNASGASSTGSPMVWMLKVEQIRLATL